MTPHAHRNSSHIQQAMGGSELDKAGRDALQPIHADNWGKAIDEQQELKEFHIERIIVYQRSCNFVSCTL